MSSPYPITLPLLVLTLPLPLSLQFLEGRFKILPVAWGRYLPGALSVKSERIRQGKLNMVKGCTVCQLCLFVFTLLPSFPKLA